MRLDAIRPVYDTPGPYAVAYLDATRASEEGAHEVGLRWRSLRSELEEQGAPAQVLQAMEDAVGGHTDVPGPHGQVLCAADRGLLLDLTLPLPPRQQTARYSPLPHLMPLVAQAEERIPYVVVITDRVGADIVAHHGGRDDEPEAVEGGTYPIRKVKPGGWSQQRYQRRAENLWEHNAAGVAEEVNGLVTRLGAQLLLVAGDVRARGALVEHLNGRSRQVLVDLGEAGRGEDGGEESLDHRVEIAVAEQIAARQQRSCERFEQSRGEGQGAADGIAATLEAARQAALEIVFLTEDQESTAEVWIGPEPVQLATSPEELSATGVTEPESDRLDAALIRAAACTGAEVEVVPSAELSLKDGVGALLRFDPFAR